MPPEDHDVIGQQAALVAVVSGRAIDELIRIDAVPEIDYAGNHGMEFRRPGQDPAPDPAAARHRPAIEVFTERWRAELAGLDIEVEDKGVTPSLHYRRTRSRPGEGAPGGRPRLDEAVSIGVDGDEGPARWWTAPISSWRGRTARSTCCASSGTPAAGVVDLQA